MPIWKSAFFASLLSTLVVFGPTKSMASTITFDFSTMAAAPFALQADSPGIIPGNCNGSSSGARCLGVNSNGAAILSVLDGTFDVVSFWFKLLGNGTDLIVSSNKGAMSLATKDYSSNGSGHALDLSSNSLFQDITYLSFLTGSGNARLDDLVVTRAQVAPVPLPATAALLLAALGGLAVLRRRKHSA